MRIKGYEKLKEDMDLALSEAYRKGYEDARKETSELDSAYIKGYEDGVAANPKREEGMWLIHNDDRWECSICRKKVVQFVAHKYCPNCGAKMG